MRISIVLSYFALAATAIKAYSVNPTFSAVDSRRAVLKKAGAVVAGGTLLGLNPKDAFASGGATAGKYT